MDMCKIDQYYTISELRKKPVKCSEELYIGRIHDVIFEKHFKLHSFILAGSRWEEFREAIGIIEDIDPIVNFSDVVEINQQEINIRIPKEELKHKLTEDIFPEQHYIYSELKRK